jgi:uncharacterized NAD(P)/FAD-binding protein YdhS
MEWFHWPYKTMLRVVRKVVRMAPEPLRSRGQKLPRRLEDLERNLNLFRHTFPWAIEKAKERYSAYHKSNGLFDTQQLNVAQNSLISIAAEEPRSN